MLHARKVCNMLHICKSSPQIFLTPVAQRPIIIPTSTSANGAERERAAKPWRMKMKRRIVALITLAVLLTVCALPALAETHSHVLRHWEYVDESIHPERAPANIHTAQCPECRRVLEIYCRPVTVDLVTGAALPYCPVCGSFDEGSLLLPELTAEEGASITRHSFGGGIAVLRAGETGDGSLLVSLCFEKYGSMVNSRADVAVTLPDGLLDGCVLNSAAGVVMSNLTIEGDTIRMKMAGSPAAILVFRK